MTGMPAPADDFDFDDWLNLAQTDRDAFDAARRQRLSLMMAGAVDRNQAHALQCQIDLERAGARGDMDVCNYLASRLATQQHALISHLQLLVENLEIELGILLEDENPPEGANGGERGPIRDDGERT